MATRGRVGLELSDGSILSIYSHWDNYPSWAGRILRTHYNTREKVEALTEDYKSLAHIIRDGNGKGSMITRLAMLERDVNELLSEFEQVKGSATTEEENKKAFNREKKIEKIKLLAVALPGIILGVIKIIEYFMK